MSESIKPVRVQKGTALHEAVRLMLRAGMTWDDAHQLFNSELTIAALELERGNICAAAQDLHMHRNSLTRQIHRAHLERLPRQLRRALTQQKKFRFVPGGRKPRSQAVAA